MKNDTTSIRFINFNRFNRDVRPKAEQMTF